LSFNSRRVRSTWFYFVAETGKKWFSGGLMGGKWAAGMNWTVEGALEYLAWCGLRGYLRGSKKLWSHPPLTEGFFKKMLELYITSFPFLLRTYVDEWREELVSEMILDWERGFFSGIL
jgi:hypothetical protein